MRRASLWGAAVSVVAMVLLGIMGNVATAGLSIPPWATIWAWAALAVLVVVAVLAETGRRAQEGERHVVGDETMSLAASDLRGAIGRQWRAEAAARGLRRPSPLRVRWSATRRPGISAHVGAILNDESLYGRRTWLRLHGDITQIVTKYKQLPHRQMVIIGEPGAGKSVLALWLTLGLLDDTGSDQPVPVLLNLSSWVPGSARRSGIDPVLEWVAYRIEQDYPFLLDAERYGKDAPLRLATTRQILPILDGLDEIAPTLRTEAIRRLDHVCGLDQPIVITSRTQEYERAVMAGGVALMTAAVIEIEPVRVEDVVTLLAPAPLEDARWRSTLAAILADPTLPLALSLTNPLMVSLARSVFIDPQTNPQVLLDSQRFPDQAAIDHYLMERFLPAVYGDAWGGVKTRRWLAFLARHLSAGETHDIAWWRLEKAVPRYIMAIIFGSVGGLVALIGGAVAGLLDGGPTSALLHAGVDGFAGLIGAGFGGVLIAASPAPTPSALELKWRGRLHHLLRRMPTGFAVGIGAALAGGLVAQLVAGLRAGGAFDSHLWSRYALLMVEQAVAVGLVFGLIVGLQAWLHAPTDQRSVTPMLLLRRDRQLAATHVAILAPLVGLAGGYLIGRIDGVVFGIAGGCAVGIVGATLVIGRTCWGRFVLVCIWLAIRRRMPWRVMHFLDRAYRIGVLRQEGAAYQFRHSRLQDYLAIPRATD